MGNEKSFPVESSSHIFGFSFWVTLIVKQLSRNFNTFPKRKTQKEKIPLYNNRDFYTNFVTLEPVRGKNHD